MKSGTYTPSVEERIGRFQKLPDVESDDQHGNNLQVERYECTDRDTSQLGLCQLQRVILCNNGKTLSRPPNQGVHPWCKDYLLGYHITYREKDVEQHEE